jgi:large subunit ribosomal protein L18Ae
MANSSFSIPWSLSCLSIPHLPMKQFVILGRRKPTSTHPEHTCPVYRMKLFAPNSVIARSRFWYYLAALKKVKKANGEIVSLHEVFEKNANFIKNFGFWIRYDSRSGTHNMYKEYRDVSLNGAVKKMYADLASRHRARRSSIQIVKTAVVKGSETRRANTQQFLNASIKFRLLHRIPRSSAKQYRSTFKATPPSTFF